MYASTIAVALAGFAPSAFAAIFDVQVGPSGNLIFDPPSVVAVAGDNVVFHFNPKNHTVTQSVFDPPCISNGGFDTGFIPVASGTDPLPTQEFTVPDNGGAPLWFYCSQTAHCGKGMVFAINPPQDGNHTFIDFQNLAIARNGTAATSPTATATISDAGDAYTTPPPPQWASATATVSWGGEVYTTTYTSYEGSAEPTPAVTPQEHLVTVGADGKLAYSPANITALINDTITFEFHQKNHTVTQSSFSNPCVSNGGFNSGFQPVSGNATTFPTFSIKVNDTAPIWVYCGQTNHCQSGMVFAVNSVESGPNNFDAFLQLAQHTANSTSNTTTTTTGSGQGSNGGVAVSHGVGISAVTGLVVAFSAFFL